MCRRAKAPIPAVYGIEQSLVIADELVSGALEHLDRFGVQAQTLLQLAQFLVERRK